MVFKSVISYFKKHKFIFIISVLTIILTTLLSLVPPQILRIIVDDVLPNKNNKLLIFAIIYMISFILIGIIDFLKSALLIIISEGVNKNIRLNLMLKVNRLNYITFTKYDSGVIEAYFSNDVEEISTLFTSGVVSILIDCLKIIGIIVSIFIYSYMVGFITLIIMILIILFTIWIRKKMYNAQRFNKKQEALVNNMVSESIDNIKTIKSYRIYDKVEERYGKVLINHFNSNQKANIFDSIYSPVMQMLKSLVIVIIISLSSINNDIFGMSLGALASSIDLITNIFKPIESLGKELQTIQKSFAAVDRINEFAKLEEDEIKDNNLIINDNIKLEFIDVSFSYDGVNNVIEHFNLALENKDTITLKGVSGAGKSTIFKLAYGLIKPNSGSVLINGVSTYKLSDEVKRKIFGIVYQDYYFSNDSIKNELTLRDKTISDEKVYQVLDMVGLNRIKDINKPLKKSDYSDGELSLFNIARAIMFDSKVLFLDEMNAKIDRVTAKKIIDVINKIKKDKLVLSINHYGELLDNSIVLNVLKN